ncbi:MAG: purine-nucleoside phosphorylase, partial [Candidatus Cryptobacteroides sp.]
STIPEVIVARHCDIPVFGMSVVTDLAHDDMPEDYQTDGAEIVKAADQAACKMTALFERMIEAL